jgi:hypothetical protein
MAKKSLKGGEYERLICKALSLWYSRNKRDDIFWRTAGSGARATTRKKAGKKTADSVGDVSAIHPTGKKFTRLVNIEIKRGYTKRVAKNDEISILNLIDRMYGKRKVKPPVLIRWIRKAMKEARLHGRKHSLIIFRRDRKRSCVVMLSKTFELLQNNHRPFIFPHDGQYCIVQYKRYEMVILRLEDFLEWCPPKAFFKKITRVTNRPKYMVGKYSKNACTFPKGFC